MATGIEILFLMSIFHFMPCPLRLLHDGRMIDGFMELLLWKYGANFPSSKEQE